MAKYPCEQDSTKDDHAALKEIATIADDRNRDARHSPSVVVRRMRDVEEADLLPVPFEIDVPEDGAYAEGGSPVSSSRRVRRRISLQHGFP